MITVMTRVWPIENGGNLLASVAATVSTDVGDIKVSRITIVRGKNGRPFVALPQQRYLKNEETRYATVLELPARIMEEIEAQVFKELGL